MSRRGIVADVQGQDETGLQKPMLQQPGFGRRRPGDEGVVRHPAIERLFANEQRVMPDVTCVLSGGAAPAVAPRLSIPYALHENIVLEGLYCIGMSPASASASAS